MNLNQYSQSAAQPGLAVDVIANLEIPLPPIEEQNSISVYLDRETARIDGLIAKKRRLIELLREKRQAVISHAVTKGLDPNAPMKDSGIEWLGQIPVHWQACRTKFVAGLYSGHTPSRDKPEYWVPEECTIPWFTLADVWQLRDGTRTYLGDTNEKISPLGLANSAARLLPAGTVIVSRTASVGFAGIMPRPMATTQDFVNWVCGDRIRPRFLLHVFRAMRGEFSRLTMGSTHQTIYMPDVRSFTTPLPPLSEQEAIIAFLDRETGRFDQGVDLARRAIASLKSIALL
jgi:type I restriction enzyme S subunit